MLTGKNEILASDAGAPADIAAVRADAPTTSVRQSAVAGQTVEPEPSSHALGTTDDAPIQRVPQRPKSLSADPPRRKPPVRSSLEPREGAKQQAEQQENDEPGIRRIKAEERSAVVEEKASARMGRAPLTATSVALPSHPEPRAVDQGEESSLSSNESSVKHLEPEFSQPASETVVVPQRDEAMRHPAASETVITKPGEGKSLAADKHARSGRTFRSLTSPSSHRSAGNRSGASSSDGLEAARKIRTRDGSRATPTAGVEDWTTQPEHRVQTLPLPPLPLKLGHGASRSFTSNEHADFPAGVEYQPASSVPADLRSPWCPPRQTTWANPRRISSASISIT